MLDAGVSSTSFSYENWVSLRKKYLQSECILMGVNYSLYEKYAPQRKWRNTCILWNNTICVRGSRVCTLFCSGNWVNLWKEYLQSDNVLKWENHLLYEKYPLQMKWRNTCVSWNNIIYVRDRSAMHIVSLCQLSYLLKGLLPASRGFQVGETFVLQNSTIQVNWRNTVSPGKKTHLC
jgi:hypothetical protein